MSDFITDGATALPGVKVDERPASGAASEWTAADANDVRSALLALRTASFGVQAGFVNPNLALVTATGASTSRALQDRFADAVNVKDFGAACDGVTNDRAALVSAMAAAAGRPMLIPAPVHISSSLTITTPLVDTMGQIFSVTSAVSIENGQPVRPEWFGSAAGNIKLAVDALPTTGGVVLLADKRYPPSYDSTTWMSKANVRIQGTRLPTYKSDRTALENGTVIEGPFWVFADGFEADLLGVDSGSTVCAARYGGTAKDAFGFFSSDHGAKPIKKGVRIGSIRGLCKGTSSLVHAVALEAIDGLTVDFAEGAMAYHGIALKAQNVNIGTLSGFGNDSDAVILKSSDYAPMKNVQIANVMCDSWDGASAETGHGLLVEAVEAAGGNVNVGNVSVRNKANGVTLRSNGSSLSGVSIGNIVADTCPIGLNIADQTAGVSVGRLLVKNATYGINTDNTLKDTYVGSLEVLTATEGVHANAYIEIGRGVFSGISSACLGYNTTDARIKIDSVKVLDGSTLWGLDPGFLNSWSDVGGSNSTFSVRPANGRIYVEGSIKPGSGGNFATLSVQLRPSKVLSFLCLGYSGATAGIVYVTIYTSGELTVQNTAQCTSALYLDGSISYPIPY